MPDAGPRGAAFFPCMNETSSGDPPAGTTPEAAPPAPAATAVHDKPDVGCLIFLFFGFIGIFLAPAILLLGGAPLILPLMFAFLYALATPFINPAEKMAPGARWKGRIVTWLVLCLLTAAAAWALHRFGFGSLAADDDLPSP